MLTDKDVEKLVDVFATKEDIKAMKADIPTREDFNTLQRSVDGFVTLHEKLDQEFTIMKEDINRLKSAVRSLGGKVE